MSLSYYFDQHVPRAIVMAVRRLGIDVLTADEDGAANWADDRILDRATILDRIVFSCDADFLELAIDRLTGGQTFSGVVYAHQLHITIGQAIRDLELIARILAEDEIRNQVIYLPL